MIYFIGVEKEVEYNKENIRRLQQAIDELKPGLVIAHHNLEKQTIQLRVELEEEKKSLFEKVSGVELRVCK
jgi:predicted enzyme involved in methoxymalonyl-ACP biosynthesis